MLKQTNELQKFDQENDPDIYKQESKKFVSDPSPRIVYGVWPQNRRIIIPKKTLKTCLHGFHATNEKESHKAIFFSNITKSTTPLKNNLYELLEVVPAVPVPQTNQNVEKPSDMTFFTKTSNERKNTPKKRPKSEIPSTYKPKTVKESKLLYTTDANNNISEPISRHIGYYFLGNPNIGPCLDACFEIYKRRLDNKLSVSCPNQPIKGSACLIEYQDLLSRYKTRKNVFFVSEKEPFRLTFNVNSRVFHDGFKNIDTICPGDLHKYPSVIRDLITGAKTNEADLYLLRGWSECWEVIVNSYTSVYRNENSELCKLTMFESIEFL